jgi:hypothetical protein
LLGIARGEAFAMSTNEPAGGHGELYETRCSSKSS